MKTLDQHLEFTVKGWAKFTDNRDAVDDTQAGVKAEDNVDMGFTAGVSWLQDWKHTFLEFGYALTYRWRENPSDIQNEHEWHHDGSLNVTQEFGPRLSVSFREQFAYTDDPEVSPSPNRTRPDSSYFANTLRLGALYHMTPRDEMDVFGRTSIKRYDEKEVADTSDRDELEFSLTYRRQQAPELGLYVLFDWKSFEYERLDVSERDFHTYYAGVGFDYDITSTLRADLNGGYQYTEYDDSQLGDRDNPFVSLRITDQLTRFVTLTVHSSYAVSATDAYPYSGEETFKLLLRADWRLRKDLFLAASADYRHETFDMQYLPPEDPTGVGTYSRVSGEADHIYAMVSATYMWNKFAFTLRHSYTDRDSDVDTSFERNLTELSVARAF